MAKVFNAAAWCVSALLLVVILWRVEAVGESIQEPRHIGAGQFVESHGIRTERWMDESMEAWRDRHLTAVREFREGGDQ